MNSQQYQYLKNHPTVQAKACAAVTREEYLAWTAQWKADYAALSMMLRADRLASRITPNTRPEKIKMLEQQIASIQKEQIAQGERVFASIPSISTPDCPWKEFNRATVMLAIRKLSKERSAAQRAQTLSPGV